MSVNGQILAQLDRLAIGRQSSRSNYDGGSDFWTLVDAAQDETYENRVETTYMTAIDTMLAAGTSWSNPTLKRWFTDHETYFETDLGYAKSGSYPALAAYLAAVGGWRVPQDAAEALTEAVPNYALPPFRVFPVGTLVADEADPSSSGMHKFGRFTATATWTESSGALGSAVGPAGALCINLSDSQTVGGTFRCTNFVASTYKDIALSLSGATQYTQTVLGKQAISSGASSGQAVVSVAATAQFTAAEYVLIYESDTLQEVAVVQSITENTSLTMASNLLNSYTTAGYVIPLFSNVAYQSGGSGSGNVDVYALPDRQLSL